ncbi:MAG TPA: family 10 glycosylhydrolase, partial [Flavisolibacter sp.]|nr:family 10 glycosylhydrolase [Flavisolibacter sp.]
FVAGTLTMLDPGLPQVRDHVTKVIADIATRYNVDGIHFDDYFYPSSNFTNQDQTTFTNNNPTGIATIEDWRRNNVNMLIGRVFDTVAVINAAKGSNIVFGVSPFGIWKAGTPAGISGTSSYSAMYCDPIAWLQAGKVDYVAPQLYWKITGAQDYNALSKWWSDQAGLYNRHIYPGLALYKMNDANAWAATEIENQITLNRDQVRTQVKGQILYSTKQLRDDSKGLRTSLQNNQFKYKALPPAMPWKDAVCPNAPVNVRREGDVLRWDAPAPATDGDLPRRYVVYQFASATEAATHRNDAQKIYAVVYTNSVDLPAGATSGYYLVTSLDDANNESESGSLITLPITGLDLQVKLSGNTAMINWRTITETNTRQFEVERSTDGTQFSKVATVGAAGNSSTPKTYRSNDFLSVEGLYYYRIKTVDLDGKYYYSDVKTVVFSGANSFVVGPNPFETFINISNLKGAKRVEVIDGAGRVFLSKVPNNQLSLQLQTGHLPAGLYYLRTTKADGTSVMTKMVKL